MTSTWGPRGASAGLTARGKGFTDLGYVRRSRPGRWRAMVPVEKAGHATGRVSAQHTAEGRLQRGPDAGFAHGARAVEVGVYRLLADGC
jgi:hypothetical protein